MTEDVGTASDPSSRPWLISQRGVNFVAHWEGFESCPYLDRLASPPVWTRGYGETEGITSSSKCITEREARQNLHHRLNHDFNPARLLPHLALRQCEVDGLASLAYNEGRGVLTDPHFSTLAKRLHGWRARRSYHYRCRIYKQELPKWDVAGGRHLEGLAKRRQAELAVCTRGDYSGRP